MIIIIDGMSWLRISGCLQVTQILDCRELGQQAGEVYQPKLLSCCIKFNTRGESRKL